MSKLLYDAVDFPLDENMDYDFFNHIGMTKAGEQTNADEIKMLNGDDINNDHLVRLFSSSNWWGSSLLDEGETDIWADLDTGRAISQKDKDEIEAKVKRVLEGREIDFEWSDSKLSFTQKQNF